MIGGVFDALMGKTNFQARAPVINTKAGQAAIQAQMQGAGQQANALGYSLAASGRGAGSGLALREAQRRGQQAISTAGAQAGMMSQQLEQSAMQQSANNQMQAQQINAGIAQSNAQGLQKLAGTALMGAALMSDERSKTAVTYPGSSDAQLLQSGRYGSQLAGHDDGRRVVLIQPDPRAQAEYEHNMAVARERGVQLTGPQQQQLMSGPQPTGPAAVSQPVTAPSATQQGLGGMGQMLMSDERSKQRIQELESANRGLMAKLNGTNAGAIGMGLAGLGAGGTGGAVTWVPGLVQRFRGQPAPAPAHVAPTPLGTHEQVVSAPTEAEALAIARAREEENARQLSADLGRREEEMIRAGNERSQLQAMPGSGGREAELARVVSDQKSKYVSDANAKVSSFLSPIRPVAYDYKPDVLQRGEGDPGRQYGLLAQDLARTPQGASVVEPGQDGMLRVQIPQLVMMNTAADAEQQREIDKLKKKAKVA